MLSIFSFVIVFIEGLLSFFSPCIIPLIPVYMAYLSGTEGHSFDNKIAYPLKKIFLHTIFFVLGISFSFFLLGLSFTTLGTFFQSNKIWFTRIGGIIIVLLGLFQIGFLDLKFLNKEKKLNIDISKFKINPIMAFVMGFLFSFAWTPCVGPALSSVLILASSASSNYLGNFLVFVYTLGFIIPFIVLGLFTSRTLDFLHKKKKILKYTVKIGGILLIIIGVMTFTGWMNGISSYFNVVEPTPSNTSDNQVSEEKVIEKDEDESTSEDIPSTDFTLIDQYGENHTLSDYKGKVIFLNFWATWCPPCKREMPHIEELYREYQENGEDIIILGVANPRNKDYPNNADVSKEGIISFLRDNEYTFPVVFDEDGTVFSSYHVSAFPTTFMIDANGNISGYIPGMLTKDMMRSIIEETLEKRLLN